VEVVGLPVIRFEASLECMIGTLVDVGWVWLMGSGSGGGSRSGSLGSGEYTGGDREVEWRGLKIS
jgi:hypothetical protein